MSKAIIFLIDPFIPILICVCSPHFLGYDLSRFALDRSLGVIVEYTQSVFIIEQFI